MAAAYQHASDWWPGHPPYSGVIKADGTWVANENSPDWNEYLAWANEGNRTDPYLPPAQGGVTIVLKEGEVPVGSMLDSLPPEEGGTVVEGLPPANRDVPYVQPDSAAVGDTLTCTMGNWDGEPTAYTGRWLRDDEPTGDEGAEYVVQPIDAGHSISCVVSCFNNYGTGVAPRSNAIAIPDGTEAQGERHSRSKRKE